MTHINWGEIAKKFDQQAHQQQIEKKQHNLYLKSLYKQNLQQMIAEQKNKTLDSKRYDRELMQRLKKKDQSQLQKEQQKHKYFRKIKEKFSHENLQTTIDKRKQQQQARQREKQILTYNYRKAATQMSEENKKYTKFKSQAKQILSHAYEQQIGSQQKRKLTQKAEDQQENKKQADRLRQLNKLKFGYRQNPQTYNYAQQIWKRNMESRNKFINNMSNQNSRILEQLERKKNSQDHKRTQIKNASQFNRGMFQQRMFKRKYESVKQVLQQHQKLQALYGEFQRQKRRKQLEKLQKQEKLKQQLQKQIYQTQMMKNKSKYLNVKQQNLNRDILSSSGHSVLPGLSQDYTYIRQQKLLENFLKGSRNVQKHQQSI